VEEQLRRRDIYDPQVLEAMRTVPREQFVDPDYARLAYSDGPLPIGEGQTISQPYIVALMTQMLNLKGNETVLEVGTGSGYQAAVLACIVREVHSIERFESLGQRARRVIEALKFNNVTIHIGDGSLGWPKNAPYQAIIVTAAAPRAPQPLLDQLDEMGRLVLPVGSPGSQVLEYWERHGATYQHEATLPVAFVPLRGEFGWKEEKWGFW